MKKVAVIQARMGSRRLPGKVLAEVAGEPLLAHVLRRARAAGRLDLVAEATTAAGDDDPVAAHCARAGIPCFRGSEEDVLDRYVQAAERFQAGVVVRLTADCPLLDPEVVDRVVLAFEQGGCDYASNTLEPTYPNGLDAEVFRREALERAWREARLPSEREHVTPYIWKNPALFRLRSVKHGRDLSTFRWTVDEPEDLRFVREVYARLGGGRAFPMDEVLGVLAAEPDLARLDARFARNEGYRRSLERDPCPDGES